MFTRPYLLLNASPQHAPAFVLFAQGPNCVALVPEEYNL
jgi:hypothetical protein